MYDASKLLRHSNIRMSEKYAHLAPDYLHKAVAGRGFSAQWRFAEGGDVKNWQKPVRKWWARLGSNQ